MPNTRYVVLDGLEDAVRKCSSVMSRKEELLKMAHLIRAQADAMNGRDAKQAFRKMADYYQREAKQLQGRPVPAIMPSKQDA